MPLAPARAAAATAALIAIFLAAAGCGDRAETVTLLTMNIANGNRDVYRTPENRARQAAFIAQSGANVVGLEEVDVDVERSGYTDTGADALGLSCQVATPPYSLDGVRRCGGVAGTYLFARALQGDDPYDLVDGLPAGIPDGDATLTPTGTDRSADADYGVALGVRGLTVRDAYAVGLPTAADQPPDDPLLVELAQSGPDSPARAELAARNLVLRTQPALEPRTALVTRLDRPGVPPLTVIVTHLEIASFPEVSSNQLSRVLAVARAERTGPPARQVVVLGDFNGASQARDDDFVAAGLRRALDLPTSVGDRLDQIWVDTDLLLLEAVQLSTQGTTDHAVAVRAAVR